MIKKVLLAHLISLITICNVVSQTSRLDSINFNKILFYRNTNTDSLFFYLKKLEQSNDMCQKIVALTGKAYGFYRQKNYLKSEKIVIDVINQVDSLLKNNNSTCLYDRKISALNRLFWIKKNQEDYEKAYKTLVKCEDIISNYPEKTQKHFRDKLGLVLNKASIQNRLTNPEKALETLYKTILKTKNPILNNIKNDTYYKQWKANIFNCFGNSYMKMYKKYNITSYIDSAANYYNKAYIVTKLFTPLHKESKIFYSFRKTEVLIAQKKYHLAIKEINSYSKINNGYYYHHREYYQKAICFSHLNKSDSAIYNAKKLIYDERKKCKRSKLITIYDILAKQYNKINKVDSAFKYSQLTLKQFNIARDNKEKISNLSYTNDFEKAQKLNIEIKKREEQKQRNLIIAFIALLSALIVIVIFMLKTEKKKKNTLIDIIKDHKPIEVEKKEYNIDEELENKILNEIKRVNTSLCFLKPDFSISTIADKLKTNSTYVSFVFNKYNDESFKQYYTRLKIEYIVKQLKTNKTYRKYSIQALAEELGYTNASAFTRAFKKQMGITPSVFLKSLDE